MKRVLLLNSDWSPLNFVSIPRAFNLMFKGRVEVISVGEKPSYWDESYDTTSRKYDIPATIRLTERISRRFSAPRFRKKVLFNRDNWQCQYCGIKLEWSSITIDHITPRCRGGTTTWKNCVASCKRCNSKKGSRTLSESDMHLKKLPLEPKVSHYWEITKPEQWHEDWRCFFNENYS
jgi:5-methylcytosine-specific restriction endonuclease McrA